MSARTTERQLQAQLARTAKAIGRPDKAFSRNSDGPPHPWNVGALVLSKEYHGWQLHEIDNDRGGVRVLFGHGTFSATDMYYALRGMEEAAEMAREMVPA